MEATVLAPVALVAVWRWTRPAKVCSALVGRVVDVRPEKDCVREDGGEINERLVSTSKRFVRVLVLVLVKPRLFFRRSVEPRSRVGKYTLTSHDSSNGIMVDWKSKKKKSTRTTTKG
jgi:hypothetical protein